MPKGDALRSNGTRRERAPAVPGPARAARKQRADQLVVAAGLAESRARAQALIGAGQIWLGETRVDKPGTLLPANASLRCERGPRFVSRGGDKLAHALATFTRDGLEVGGKICVDVGASTGGFTDCLLQHGAGRVFAVDVGHGQLHPKLRTDARVVVWERTNARHLPPAAFDEPIDLVVVDASFIGIGKLVGAIASWLAPRGDLVVLVKPQFEAGRAAASRGRGVVRDPEEREAAIHQARQSICEAGFDVLAETDCPVHGPKGNIERLLYARRSAPQVG